MKFSNAENDQLIAWRRDFHQNPEPGYQETRTARIVAEHLRALRYDVQTEIGVTGVIGLLKGQRSGKTFMIRADMDCLPIKEATGAVYESKVPGMMHACGHDGHVAILMLVAQKIAAQNNFSGNIKLVFQPAEEGGNGAEKMVNEGALENPKVDNAIGLHLWNSLPVGKVGLNPGALMAGVDAFEVTIRGKGGHGAAPHQTVDPIVVTAQVINALQTIVSRSIDPLQSAVVTVGSVHAGEAFNVIPESAVIKGTARFFDPEIGNRLPRLFEQIVKGVTASAGATCEISYEHKTPPTINDASFAAWMRDVAVDLVGKENVIFDSRTMGGEDMSFFLQNVPGCFFFVGAANPDGAAFPHHSSKFDIDERSLEIGAALFLRAIEKYFQTA